MIRSARIIKFGHWIVETDEFAIIHSDGEFIVPSVEGFKRHMQNRLPGKYQNALTTRKTMVCHSKCNFDRFYNYGFMNYGFMLLLYPGIQDAR